MLTPVRAGAGLPLWTGRQLRISSTTILVAMNVGSIIQGVHSMPNTRRMAELTGIPYSDLLDALTKVIGAQNLTFLTLIGKTDNGEPIYFISENISQKVYAEFTPTLNSPKEESTDGSD